MRSPYFYRILLVDQEAKFRNTIWRALRRAGYLVKLVHSACEGWDSILEKPPDLVILQARLPDIDGITLCKALREEGYEIPILILACDTTSDCIAGLNAGADSCLNNTIEASELLARVRALLRRIENQRQRFLRFADLTLDLYLRESRRGSQVHALGPTEFDLLQLFLHHPDQVLERDRIISHVWGFDYDPASNVLEVYMHYLRRKLGKPRLIETVRYVGYVLRAPILEQ